MGMISETKTLHLGVKNWAIDLKFCTLVDDQKLSKICYVFFLKILTILDFRVHCPKKSI